MANGAQVRRLSPARWFRPSKCNWSDGIKWFSSVSRQCKVPIHSFPRKNSNSPSFPSYIFTFVTGQLVSLWLLDNATRKDCCILFVFSLLKHLPYSTDGEHVEGTFFRQAIRGERIYPEGALSRRIRPRSCRKQLSWSLIHVLVRWTPNRVVRLGGGGEIFVQSSWMLWRAFSVFSFNNRALSFFWLFISPLYLHCQNQKGKLDQPTSIFRMLWSMKMILF